MLPLPRPRTSRLRRSMLRVAAFLALCAMGSGLTLADAPQPDVHFSILSEPFVICPGWNPHYTIRLTNLLDVPLSNLVIMDPLPAGTCCARNAYRATIQGAYRPELEAFVWELPVLEPGASVVGHVLFHSYSSLPHGTRLTNEVIWWADGHMGAGRAEVVVVDYNRCQYPGQVWPTFTPTLTPSPMPTLPPTPTATPTPSLARLRFEPDMAQMGLHEETAVSLFVEHVRGLYGLDLRIAYDPTLVEILDGDAEQAGIQVERGEAPYPDFVVRNEVDPAAGVVAYAVTQLNPRAPYNGTGTVLTLHLRGQAEGRGALTIADWQLVDPETYEIEAEVTEGRLRVGPTWYVTPDPDRRARR